ncbi:MAG: class I SAM-dependent methyltransferase [Aggregatilineales bacterium]
MRQHIYEQYSLPKINFVEWVLSRIAWRGDECVLDIGAGQSAYFEHVQMRIPNGELISGDLSMKARCEAEHPAAYHVLNFDAQHLPFPKHAFDVVLANHALFHVPDVNRALSEIHRVLKPSGVLLAATASCADMPELDMLFKHVFNLLGISPKAANLAERSLRFYLEDAPKLAGRHFFAVARHDLPSILLFTSPQPLVDYVKSLRAYYEPTLPRSITWDDFVNVLTDLVRRIIKHTGEVAINKLSGAIVASDMGGFSSGYVQKLLTAQH